MKKIKKNKEKRREQRTTINASSSKMICVATYAHASSKANLNP